ncbi:MAG: hypothetical protein EOR16_30170 [Mesorhizobium sp.]|uniref:hypothetical protein n=1 Tax=Mesorhizobium sp. TaxID=1871066 RepID=UPI000FE89606|nr:hypothetical protein [Mesorhizobium sp.]RWI50527.1 MAG: hypothetical protein EOR16_30170 [Mesorhizobium sp.]
MLKRPAGDDVKWPAAKRQRSEVSGESKQAQANLARLPAELQLKILRDLVLMNLDDPQTALRGVAAFRRMSQSLREAAETAFSTETLEDKRISGNSRITSHGRRLADVIKDMSEIPIRSSAETMKDLNARNAAMYANSIAVRDKRSDIVRSALKLEEGPIKYDAIQSLILNIDNIPPRDRPGIVRYVCDTQSEDGDAEDLVKNLIERAENLAPADRALLAKTSCRVEDADKRRECLNAWAGRTHLLEKAEERNVLSGICESSDGKGYSLGSFATHISKVSLGNRPLLVENIIGLSSVHPGRMWAMSQLAANFRHLREVVDSSGGSFERAVTRDILDKASQPPNEPAAEDLSQWHTEPSLCLVEAVHHLSCHKGRLDGDEINRVDSHIRGILQDHSVEAYPRRAQLISHMSDKERGDFFGKALKAEEPAGMAATGMHGKSIRDGVILALTLRVKDLSSKERQTYVNYVCNGKTKGKFVEEALSYNFNEHLGDFGGKQRTLLVNERLDTLSRSEAVEATKILSDIAQNARFLEANDISNVIEAAKVKARSAYPHSDDNDFTMNSFAGISARVLANWSREFLSSSLNPRGLDDRSYERSTVR